MKVPDNKPIAKITPVSKSASFKVTRKEWIDRIQQLHRSLGQLGLKDSMSQFIVKVRKGERF